MRNAVLLVSITGSLLLGFAACGGGEEAGAEDADAGGPSTAPTTGSTSGGEGASSGAGTSSGTSGGATSSGAPEGGASSGTPATPTQGCGAPAAQSGFATGLSVQVDGATRTYALFVPPTYDVNKPYPLVFAFHGDGGNGAGIRGTMKLEEQANGAAIFVYPDGVSKTWELDQPAAKNKDIKLVTALVDKLSATYCTDATRRFAAGFSRGAYFANQLVCRSPRAFRGVASHGGGGPYGLDGEYDANGNWACTAPLPAALVVHGANDDLGDFGAESRDFYRTGNACKTTTKPYAPSPCVAYDGCAAGKPLVFCKIPSMGHAFWTSGPTVTWSFFASL